MFCRSLFVLLYFFFRPLCCLSFDLRILSTPFLWYLQTLLCITNKTKSTFLFILSSLIQKTQVQLVLILWTYFLYSSLAKFIITNVQILIWLFTAYFMIYICQLTLVIIKALGLSWSWSYSQSLSPHTLWNRNQHSRGVLDTTLCDKVCQWLATGR
jgi:hypothetical protein